MFVKFFSNFDSDPFIPWFLINRNHRFMNTKFNFYWHLRSIQKSNNNVSNANIIIIIVRPLRNPTFNFMNCDLCMFFFSLCFAIFILLWHSFIPLSTIYHAISMNQKLYNGLLFTAHCIQIPNVCNRFLAKFIIVFSLRCSMSAVRDVDSTTAH